MVRITIRLEENQMSELRMVATRQGTSVSALIRAAVDRLLAADAEMREKAKAVAGCCNSGTGDLAERHDDYLEEAYSE